MWRWLLAVCLLWVGTLAEEMSLSCPDHCKCLWDQDNYRAARCTPAAVNPHYVDVYPFIQALNIKPLHSSQSVQLAPKMFHRFRNIKILNLANCSVYRLPDDVFLGLRYASDIDLSYNRIRSINGIVFKSLPVLQTLLLRGNPLILNNSSIISDSLKELDMGDCGLRSIPDGTFAHVNRLTHLSLDGNLLQTIYYQSIPMNLRYLNLASNRITNVPTKVLLEIPYLRRIDLSNNPVNCTCELMLMQDWFSGRAIALENDVICYSPEPYQGMNLNKINENELCKYEMHHGRQINKLRFPSHKATNSYHVGTEFNALPTYDVLMADQPEPDHVDTEVFKSDQDTRSLGTHMESSIKEPSKESLENVEGSGSDGEFTIDSAEEKHSTVIDPEDSARESLETSSESTPSPSDSDKILTSSLSEEVSAQNSSSVEEENSSKNQSFEIDSPSEGETLFPATSHETSTPETEPLTTTEEYESSGGGPLIISETSSTVQLIDDKETISSTTETSVEIVSQKEPIETSSTTEASSTEAHTETSPIIIPAVEVTSAHPVSEEEETPTTVGPEETSTDSHHIHIPDLVGSKEEETTSEPSSPSTTEGIHIPVEVTEGVVIRKKIVTEGLEHYSELSTEASVASGTEDIVARADSAGITQSITTYIIIAVIALPVIILILMAACRKKGPTKVRLPHDTESNLGTELQDMDTLLPKNGGAENGVKVVPKANGAANPADSKSPEEVAPVLQEEPEPEVEPPVVEEPPPSRQNGATTPIQKTKAKLTVIADSIPKTPVFIHKSFPE